MKTSLDLDSRLIEEAKRLAAERGVTPTSIIEDALRDSLAQRRPVPPVPFDMPVVEGRTRPDTEISDRDALYDRLDDRN